MKLSTIVLMRLATVVLLALALQVAITLFECFFDEEYFTKHYVNIEAERIAQAARLEDGNVVVDFAARLPYYVNHHASAYALRILDMDGRVLLAINRDLIEQVSPSLVNRTPLQFWLRQLDNKTWFHVAGGAAEKISDRDVVIELATLGDPAFVRSHVILSELFKDVWLPMGPLILLTIVIAPFSVHRMLRPLAQAAEQADKVKATDREARLALTDLPREAASFVSAINRLMDRVTELVQAQKSFISRAAHELRTPLSIMLMELEKIADPRARRLAIDVADMSNTVNRLLVLARIDAMTTIEEVDIDLGALTRRALERLNPLAESRGVKINVKAMAPEGIRGDASSIYEAIRNLLENAIKHTPAGSTVAVTCGPGLSWTVEDDGAGLAEDNVRALFEPFHRGRARGEGAGLGLAIVKQTMELHNGSVEASRSSMGGARFTLRFPPAGASPGPAAVDREGVGPARRPQGPSRAAAE